MPIIAIRTINFENVRFDLNVIRADIKEAKLNGRLIFCTFANMRFCC
jgi:hypothetical protein